MFFQNPVTRKVLAVVGVVTIVGSVYYLYRKKVGLQG